MNSETEALGEALGSSEVVGTVSEGLETFVDRVVLAVVAVLGDGWVAIELAGGLYVGVSAFVEHGLEFRLLALCDDNAEVGLGEVEVEEGKAWVGDEDASDVGKAEVGVVFFTPLWDVLEVSARAKGVLGRGEAKGLCAADVEGSSHPLVHVERHADECGEEDTKGTVLLDGIDEGAKEGFADLQEFECFIVEGGVRGRALLRRGVDGTLLEVLIEEGLHLDGGGGVEGVAKDETEVGLAGGLFLFESLLEGGPGF